jgi:hypothetical protein
MLLQGPPIPPNGPPGGFSNGPFESGPCEGFACIPIDQGFLLVTILGLIIGLYFLNKERKQK